MYVKTWKRGSVCIIEKARFYKSARAGGVGGRWTMSCVFPFCLCLIFYRFSFLWLRKWIRSLTKWWRRCDWQNKLYICFSRGDLKEHWTRNAFTFEKKCGTECFDDFHLYWIIYFVLWMEASSARHIIGICDCTLDVFTLSLLSPVSTLDTPHSI